MSYDIDIGREWFNYTSNLSKLFYDHIPPMVEGCRGGLHALNGKTGRECVFILGDALNRIHRTYCEFDTTDGFRNRYDALNGWGSTDGAILFLGRILAACALNPRSKVRVSA